MIEVIKLMEYQELMKQVSPETLIDCSRRACFNTDLPDRGPIGSLINEVRINRMIKLIIEELRKEIEKDVNKGRG